MPPAVKVMLAVRAHNLGFLENFVRGDRADQAAPGPQDTKNLRQRFVANLDIQMLDDLAHDDSVELIVGKGHVLAVALLGAFPDGETRAKSFDRTLARIERPNFDPFPRCKDFEEAGPNSNI
jgi:hypothetical protein